ncbi:UNVERIFIED_CONTAM: Pyruvate dehydrogenase E1 component subunit beta-3, chloroplastic [Sesamum radiatum]|uniref:pyruvate dehydrogenase (acetyl-transferring) n=1 Tax=Sesamum radiatum TaxID=300843 RepID=A0AAW2KGU0_SESRA
MASAFMQGVGATTALSSANYKNSCFAPPRSLPVVVDSTTLPLVGSGPTRFQERKGSFFVIRSDGSVNSGLNPRIGRRGTLSTNAVATKQDNVTSSTASKPGHELLLFEALREGLEEEMDRDPRVCVMGEDVGHYGGSYKVTKGLATKFGDLRVLDTPLLKTPSLAWP